MSKDTDRPNKNVSPFSQLTSVLHLELAGIEDNDCRTPEINTKIFRKNKEKVLSQVGNLRLARFLTLSQIISMGLDISMGTGE